MKKSRGKDDFLQTPEFLGGDKAMKEFVAKNLIYPDEAKVARIEGKVIVGYQVTDNGKILSPHIIKGLGHGCDEEALRIISLFRFSKVKNRKRRVKVTKKTTIHFRLPKININYSVTSKEKTPPPSTQSKEDSDKKDTGYSYTIDIN